jgi:hypothetical protein
MFERQGEQPCIPIDCVSDSVDHILRIEVISCTATEQGDNLARLHRANENLPRVGTATVLWEEKCIMIFVCSPETDVVGSHCHSAHQRPVFIKAIHRARNLRIEHGIQKENGIGLAKLCEKKTQGKPGLRETISVLHARGRIPSHCEATMVHLEKYNTPRTALWARKVEVRHDPHRYSDGFE